MSKKSAAPRSFSATVTYLAMETRPAVQPPPRPLLKTAILRAENPPVHFYRYLYDVIGRDYLWVERRNWSDAELEELLSDQQVALYILYIGGVPGGLAELDFREPKVGQIAYFGLTPDFVGRRIGPWFLHQTIELCWTEPIEKLRVNTCTLDHRRALSTYQRAGFVPYARGQKVVTAPADMPAPAARH